VHALAPGQDPHLEVALAHALANVDRAHIISRNVSLLFTRLSEYIKALRVMQVLASDYGVLQLLSYTR
jgi:predicted transcriptional regulator